MVYNCNNQPIVYYTVFTSMSVYNADVQNDQNIMFKKIIENTCIYV